MSDSINADPIKKAKQKTSYTKAQLRELILCGQDPLYFMRRFMKVQHPLRGAVDFIPFPYQERIIRAFRDHHWTVVLTGRQQGKTTCAAGYLLWKAMFCDDTKILITANKFLQALEVMDRIKYVYENLPDFIRDGVLEYNKSSITFDNGSKITARATSADAGRGLSITLLYCDEFAFVPPNKQKEFWTSITPTLSTGGACILTSTPKNDEDQFAVIYKGACDTTDEFGNQNETGVGRNGFYAVKSPWWEHPERDEAWATTFREALGEARFRQEFACEFVADDETLISNLRLAVMTARDPDYFTGTVRWYCDPEPNKAYLIGLDPSLGTGGDCAAIQVYQLPEMKQVAEWQHNGTPPRGQVRILMQVLLYLDTILREDPRQGGEPELFWSFENNSIGEAILTIIEDTGEERFPGILVNDRRAAGQSRRFRKGMTTANRNKLSACARLKSLIESGRMEVNSRNLLKELKNFVATDSSFRAKPGETDDLIMALILIVRMLDFAIQWVPEGHDLREHIDEDELMSNEPMPVAF